MLKISQRMVLTCTWFTFTAQRYDDGNLQGAVGYMVEVASKKDFAPGKGRILKETLISIGMLPISLELF